jgi:uncharacterized protein YbjT (DUF2867 family)
MRILLTGATGFIGRHLLTALLAEGHHVACAGRQPATAPPLYAARLSHVPADFTQDTGKAIWLARLEHIDVVINAVGIFKESGRQTFALLHEAAPRALFAACAESDHVRLVIQLSALGADRHAETPYHLSKKAADDVLAQLPVRAFIVQPSLVYGKDGASARALRGLASLPVGVRLGSAPQLVQPIHIDDLVACLVALLRRPLPVDASGQIAQRVALVGPEPMPFVDYLRRLRRAMGMGRLHVLPLPDVLARLAARLASCLPGSLLDPDALRMLNRNNVADPGMTTRLLGHAPRPVESFIEDPKAERVQARLTWLLPTLRMSLAVLWIWTAIVSAFVYPVEESLELLSRSGIPPDLGPLMLYGAAGLDFLLGAGILLLRRRRWLWAVQFLLVAFYTVVIAVKLPEFLMHPYGPLSKNLPILAAIWLLYALEDD